MYHYTWKHSDRITFSRLGICFGNGVRLLAITSALTLNVRGKRSLTSPKGFHTKDTKSVYQTKYVLLLLVFFLFYRWPCMQKSLVLMTCMFIDEWFDNFTSTKNKKKKNSELKQWAYFIHQKRYCLSLASFPV